MAWLIILILSLIWSSTWMAIKVGLGTMPPFLSAGLRFLIAFVVIMIYALIVRLPVRYSLKNHIFFIFFSLTNFFGGYALVYWGEQYINSGLASVLFSVMPFYVAVLSLKFLPSEQVSLKKFIGIFVGFLGVAIIFRNQLQISHPYALYGMAGLLISPAFSAFGAITVKKAGANFHAVTLNMFPLLYAAIGFFICYFLFEGQQPASFTPAAIFSLFYLGAIGTSLAFVLYFQLLKTVSAVVMSLIAYVTPPLALIWGWAMLGETVTIELLIGMAIIFSGIVLVRRG
jgi:putative membrane protein PagO